MGFLIDRSATCYLYLQVPHISVDIKGKKQDSNKAIFAIFVGHSGISLNGLNT